MVVVVIISVIAAVVLPKILRSIGGDGKAVTKQASLESQQLAVDPSRETTAQTEPRKRGAPPIIEDARIRVELEAREQRVGMEVFTRFEARYAGDFTLRMADGDEGPLEFTVFLPLDTAEDLSLVLQGAGHEGEPEPEELFIDHRAVTWVGTLPKPGSGSEENRITARLSFTARGQERFVYRLPPARRLQHFAMSLVSKNFPLQATAKGALLPKRSAEKRLEWEYKNLVSERPIIVALPGAHSPLGRVMFLLKLVGLAVLLFGAGFWYLSEVKEPGCLDSFRWGHFLLLALTYSLFFAVYAILGFKGVAPLTSLLVAGALSMPLLMLHVSAIMGKGFTLTYTLPLAAFTIGMVVNGVYGEEWQSYVYIGGAFVVVAYLTLSYPTLARKREARMRRREAKLAEDVRKLDGPAAEARRVFADAFAALGSRDAAQHADLRKSIEEGQERLAEQLRTYETLEAEQLRIQHADNEVERRYVFFSLERSVHGLGHALPSHAHALRESVDELLRARASMQASHPRQEGVLHCAACGHGWEGSPFCPSCGKAAPEALDCGSCGAVLQLLRHLIDEAKEADELHCLSCGDVL